MKILKFYSLAVLLFFPFLIVGQCPTPSNFNFTETDLGNGNCNYEFSVPYTSGANNTSMEITISCGSTTFVGPDACTGALSSAGGTLNYGPFTTVCCSSDPQLAYSSWTNKSCGGNNCANGSIILPVELVAFEVFYLGVNNFKIQWSTTQEINNDFFTIQHSKNAIDFVDIEKVNGNGDSKIRSDYSSLISVSDILGSNYFRLKQVDLDGNINYSYIIQVTAEVSEKISLVQNPVSNTIIFNKPIKGTIEIINTNGQVVKIHNIESKQMNVNDLQRGIYILSVTDLSSRNTIIKFVKN